MTFFSPLLRLLLLLLLTNALTARAQAAGSAEGPSPRRADSKTGEVVNFSLLDYQGKYYELRRSDVRVMVLFFTSFDCPIARQNVPKLKALRRELSDKGVTIWLVNSCPQDDPDDSAVEMLAKSHHGDRVPEPRLEDPEARRLAVFRSLFGGLPVPRDEMQLVAPPFGQTAT